MKTYTKQQLVRIIVISVAIAIVNCIVMFATGMWELSGNSVGYLLIMIPMSLVCLPLSFMSLFFLSMRKFIVGFIAPIPVLSSFIEYFKGLGRAVLAIIALIKGKDSFTFNKYGVDKDENDE